jgi:hypothetical protein
MLAAGGIAVLLVIVVLAVSIFSRGPRELTALENIHGIPFAVKGQDTLVTETLAHADIRLQEPVVAKELQLTISFTPDTVKHLSVGVRQDPFWLSYAPTDLYIAGQGNASATYTRTLHIPLTSALQDSDRSIDVMFFADYAGLGHEDLAQADTTRWELHNISAYVSPVWPGMQIKDYIKSFIKRERPL